MKLPSSTLWAIEPTRFQAMCEALGNRDLRSQSVSKSQPSPYPLANGVATIAITGIMEKDRSLLGYLFGGCSTIAIRQQIQSAVADERVKTISLVIDSGGGEASGTADLAYDVRQAAKVKRVEGIIDGCACSAAYWVASQCSTLHCTSDAWVGNVGSYIVVRDWSAAFKADGVQTHVVKTGTHKGVGVLGSEVTDEQLAELQKLVDSTNDLFEADVRAGRKLSDRRWNAIANGEIHVGRDAVSINLCDGLGRLSYAPQQTNSRQPLPSSGSISKMQRNYLRLQRSQQR